MWFFIKLTHSLGCVKRKKSDTNVSKLIFKLVTSFLKMFLVGQRLNLDIWLAQHLTLVLIPTRWQHHIMHFARQTKMGLDQLMPNQDSSDNADDRFNNSSPPRQNGRHFTDDIFKWNFVNEKFDILIWISLKFVSYGPIENKSALVQVRV